MNMLVYIAGPIHGSGTELQNLRRALVVAQYLAKRGFVPFVPHLWLMWEFLVGEVDQELFMTLDFAFLTRCHLLVRIPGVSPGADREVVRAGELGIPVIELGAITGGLTLMQSVEKDYEDLAERLAGVTAPVVTFEDFQDRVSTWLHKQPFGANQHTSEPALGVVEETAELRGAMVDAMHVRGGDIARAVLKSKQGIRGSADAHAAKMKDAIGDIAVYAAGFCNASGFNLQECVTAALQEIESRDWAKYPKNGKTE